MFRPLSTFQLPTAAQSKLQESGFVYYEDLYDAKGVCSVKAIDLVKPWITDLTEHLKRLTAPPPSCSALDFWHEECSSRSIVSFCKELDDVLGGGLPVRSITELCGAPGSGKTQLCLQFCIDVQIPKLFGGLEGEAIVISTDSGFRVKRLKDMAEGCMRHCQFIANQKCNEQDQELRSKVANLSVNSFLKGVNFVATHSSDQLIGAVHLIHEVIHENKKIKLIVIDSLAFPFRDGEMNTLERTGIIYRLLGELDSLAHKHALAVVLTNQLTTKILPNKESQLIPAMGENFGHRVCHRLMLGHILQERFAAILLKSPSQPKATANFQITRDGIRDC